MPKKKDPDYNIEREFTYARGQKYDPVKALAEELLKPTTTVHAVNSGYLQDGRGFVTVRVMYKSKEDEG